MNKTCSGAREVTMKFRSTLYHDSSCTFPEFTGTRVMMMPFEMTNMQSLPSELAQYRPLVRQMVDRSAVTGVGYLTVDEALVRAGETHRRPGLHVDGLGGWGGGGGGWAKSGMLCAASVTGCVAYHQEFEGEPGLDGDCEHLRHQAHAAVRLEGGHVYWCGPLCVHESIVMLEDTQRQFIRLSLPSDAPWYEGYTPNPTGVRPTGPILPRRAAQMGFRP